MHQVTRHVLGEVERGAQVRLRQRMLAGAGVQGAKPGKRVGLTDEVALVPDHGERRPERLLGGGPRARAQVKLRKPMLGLRAGPRGAQRAAERGRLVKQAPRLVKMAPVHINLGDVTQHVDLADALAALAEVREGLPVPGQRLLAVPAHPVREGEPAERERPPVRVIQPREDGKRGLEVPGRLAEFVGQRQVPEG